MPFIIKTWIFNTITKTIDSSGLWKNKTWDTEQEARQQFQIARNGQQEYIAVSLNKIDENEEISIDEWEGEIPDYCDECGRTEQDCINNGLEPGCLTMDCFTGRILCCDCVSSDDEDNEDNDDDKMDVCS